MNDNPFDNYKDEVEYQYILKGVLPYKIVSINGSKPSEDQIIDSYEEFENNIDTLLKNEDYIKDSFEEPGLGRVYCKLDDMDENIEIIFGISTIDSEKTFTTQDLIDDVKEFMHVLDSNTDYVSVVGFGGNEDPRDDTDPVTLRIKQNGDIEVEVIKEPKTKTEEFDKRLVNENKLIFNKDNDQIILELKDDGNVEKSINTELKESFLFSKSAVVKECKECINLGYELQEAEIPTKNNEILNTEKTTQDLEKAIKDVDKLQDLKNELDDKVDTLMNESKENNFPSTDFTQRTLNVNEIDSLNLNDNLNQDQIDFIVTNICSIDELKEGLIFLLSLTGFTDNLISIDEYINQLLNKEVSNNE